MSTIDIVVIAVYFSISIGIALFFSKRSGKSTSDFFLSGRTLPWWIAGTTMVATTFAADTPLAVAELVRSNGISGNWLWWNMVAGNIFTVFFFARLWRRAEIFTDVEFIELRYSGKPAAFLRGFKAVYLGLFINAVIMGWVNVALAEILSSIFNISGNHVIFIIIGTMLFVAFYSAVTGLSGISYTDAFQFLTAMGGCTILAWVVLDLPQVGGIAGLKQQLSPQSLSFFPEISFNGKSAAAGVLTLSFSAFIAHIGVQWWASWYPGSEPGGGGYVAQRMMSSRSERDSLLATLWFSVAHFALRPWPWIIVGLAALILYPDLTQADAKKGFILAMKDHLPVGLFGLLIAAFLAAYMSTISTHLNWGSSYIINDLYRRFIKRDGDERHYVMISRVTILLLTVFSSLLIFVIKSISGAWLFLIECGAGLGLVLIVRWFWWRVNAWSEISAMIAPVFAYIVSKFVLGLTFPDSLFFITAVTTLVWIPVTMFTAPVDEDRLKLFYNRVRPPGSGWKRFSGGVKSESVVYLLLNWVAGIILVYSFLFGIGKLIFMEYTQAGILISAGCAAFIFIYFRSGTSE
jgi:SSS family solute:Na+ symporter